MKFLHALVLFVLITVGVAAIANHEPPRSHPAAVMALDTPELAPHPHYSPRAHYRAPTSRSHSRRPLAHQHVHHPGCGPSNWRSLLSTDEAYIVAHEQGVSTVRQVSTERATHAWNPVMTSTGHALGIGQLTDYQRQTYGRELGVDPDSTDPCAQVAMMRLYISGRYGSSANAVGFWRTHGWY